MSDHYILQGQTPVKVTLHEWAEWLNTANRHVAVTSVGEYRVSTVFLGLDHSFGDGGLPVLFESLVFKGEHSWDEIDGRRYHFWSEAENGHAELVAELEKKVEPEIRARTAKEMAENHSYYKTVTEPE